MKTVDIAYQEFADGIHTALCENGFRLIAERMANALGFRWFAYLGLGQGDPVLISSYPRAWTSHYFDEGYEQVDPVVDLSRKNRQVFVWDGVAASKGRSARERRFFDDAGVFGIRKGLTVPIAGGFGRVAAFTLATDERSAAPDPQTDDWKAFVQLIGLTYHAHVDARLGAPSAPVKANPLTQRSRECLAWTARGKTMDDIAGILGVSSRVVKFHLDNARRSLEAETLAHAVGIALRRGLLP